MSNSLSKKLFIVLLALFFFFSPLAAKNVYAWDAVAGAFAKRALDTMYNNLVGVQMAMLKQQAFLAINKEVDHLIYGRSSGGAMIISDYNDYLYLQPQSQATRYLNDYLSQVTRGRGSRAGYISNRFEGYAGRTASSYASRLVKATQNSIAAQTDQILPQMTYVGDPSRMFSSGNFRNLNLYLSGINNPWAFQMNAEMRYLDEKARLEKINLTKAQTGSGIIGPEKNGRTLMPGSVVKDMIVDVKTMGSKIIASANYLPEIIGATVANFIGASISNGLGQIQQSVHKEVTNVHKQTVGKLNREIRSIGPGALYKR